MKALFKVTLLILPLFPKSAGLDNLSGRFLRVGTKALARPITDLCNFSNASIKLPESCKGAKLKLLHKKGSLTEPSDHRHVSLLPLISKAIEKVIHDQGIAFLNSKNLIYNYPSGFRKNYSTEFCLSFLNEKMLKGFDDCL